MGGGGFILAEMECKDVFLEQFLLHHVIKGRSDIVHRDAGITQPHDTVELGGYKNQPWHFCGLGKCLVFNGDVANLKERERESHSLWSVLRSRFSSSPP